MTFSEQDVSKIVANLNRQMDREWYRGFAWGVLVAFLGVVLGLVLHSFGN